MLKISCAGCLNISSAISS